MDQEVIKWLHSASGRSKRSKVTKEGCFMLEHEATGRFYVSESASVSEEVDNQLKLLALSKHPNKLLNGLYSKDGEIRVYEYPAKGKSARTKLLGLLVTLEGEKAYLCLNHKPRPVRRKRLER